MARGPNTRRSEVPPGEGAVCGKLCRPQVGATMAAQPPRCASLDKSAVGARRARCAATPSHRRVARSKVLLVGSCAARRAAQRSAAQPPRCASLDMSAVGARRARCAATPSHRRVARSKVLFVGSCAARRAAQRSGAQPPNARRSEPPRGLRREVAAVLDRSARAARGHLLPRARANAPSLNESGVTT